MTTDTVEIQAHITKLENEAEATKVGQTRHFPNMKVGQIVRQGDIYIHMVEDSHPHGPLLVNRQLAQGVSQGSRHIAEPPAMVYEGTTKAASSTGESVFLGPCIKSESEFTISHPQHANVTLGPGTYQVSHQMDIRTLQRVRD